MKLFFARPTAWAPRHIVLKVDREIQGVVRDRLVSHVLPSRVQPVEQKQNGQVLFRLHTGYLSRLVEAFPEAELSDFTKSILKSTPTTPPHLDIPGFKGKLYPYQLDAVWRVINEDSIFLWADLGTGKTLVTLAALQYMGQWPALIVCPNSVKQVWADEAEKWFPGQISTSIVGGTKPERIKQIRQRAQLTVVHFEALRLHPELAEQNWAAIVVDEHHNVCNPTAQKTKSFHRIAQNADRRIMLSGTPSRNGRFEELWSPLKAAWPQEWPAYYVYLHKYTVQRKIGRIKTIVGYTKAASEINSFTKQHSIRVKKLDVLKDLPPMQEAIRYVELSKEQRKLYEKIRDKFLLELDDGTIKNIPGILSQLTRLKQVCFSPELYGGSNISSKMDEIRSIVQEVTQEGYKLLVFSQWSRVTEIVRRELGANRMAYVTGDVPVKERAVQVKRFQNDDRVDVFCGTYGACKEGLTLTAASYVVLVDIPWTPADVDQAVARAWRIGQPNSVLAISVMAEDTLEERLAKKLDDKRSWVSSIVDHEKWVRPDRALIQNLRDII